MEERKKLRTSNTHLGQLSVSYYFECHSSVSFEFVVVAQHRDNNTRGNKQAPAAKFMVWVS
jgi:hypothetical protein